METWAIKQFNYLTNDKISTLLEDIQAFKTISKMCDIFLRITVLVNNFKTNGVYFLGQGEGTNHGKKDCIFVKSMKL